MKLPLISGKDFLTILKKMGFSEKSRKGSHVKMEHPDGRIIVFPYHKEIDRYTLKGALKDAEIDLEEFIRIIRRNK